MNFRFCHFLRRIFHFSAILCVKICPDFATNYREEWRVSSFQSNLRKQFRNLPKILNFVKIIDYYSKLFTSLLTTLFRGPLPSPPAKRSPPIESLSQQDSVSKASAESPGFRKSWFVTASHRPLLSYLFGKFGLNKQLPSIVQEPEFTWAVLFSPFLLLFLFFNSQDWNLREPTRYAPPPLWATEILFPDQFAYSRKELQ